MSILVDEYEPVVDVEDDPFEGERDVQVRTDVWVTAEYEILPEILGRGRFGEVKRCRQYSTGREFAAKFILAPRPQDKKDVIHEVEVMKKLRHRRLLQVNDAFCFKNETCLILEIILGGELFDRVIDDTFILTEKACQCFVRQICEGVEYMHANNIIHLDLKPENILCLSKAGNRIKIIDFGLAREYDPRKELRVLFGTPEFMAPEVVQYDTITFATDIWSIGVISYVLLSGLSPFMGDSDGDTLTNVIKVDYSFDYDEFGDISQDAKDLISNLLQRDKRKRLTATECLAHAWLKKEGATPPPLSPSLDLSKQRLKRFVYRRKWQKAVHCIIALRRMGAQFINVARKRSLTRMEAAAHAKQEAEKNAMRRGRASTSNSATSVSEQKPKVAHTGNPQAGKDAASSTASRAKDGNVNIGARSKVKSDDKSATNDGKRQGHFNDGNTVPVAAKTKEAIKSDKTSASHKNASGNIDSKAAVRKDKPKPAATDNNNAAVSPLKDGTGGKPRQKLAKDNFDFLNKHSPEAANKSVIFQLPTLRKIPKKSLNPVTMKTPLGSDAGKNVPTNKSTPKAKLQEPNAGKQMDSPAKDKFGDRCVEQKEKSGGKSEPKKGGSCVVKHTDLKAKHNVPAKHAEANIEHVHASNRQNVHTGHPLDLKTAETCLTHNEINRNPVKDSNPKEPRRYEKHPSAETGDRAKTEDDDSGRSDSVNRLCMQWPPPETDKPVNQWKPRIQIINKVGEVLKPDGTIDEQAAGSSPSAGSKPSKSESQTNTVEKSDEKKVQPTAVSPKPKVQLRSKVEGKPRGDIPNNLSSKVDIPNTLPSKFEVKPRGNIPNTLPSKVEAKPHSDQLKSLPSKVEGKQRGDIPNMLLSKFETKPRSDQPKTLPSNVEEKPRGEIPNTVNGPSRLNKRPKRPNLNCEGPQDDNIQKTFAGRKAQVLDRCPWSKKEANDTGERMINTKREHPVESIIGASIARFHAETSTESSVSGTTISTTNKTTTSSILRRSSLTRRERLVSDDDGVHGKAWSKPKRISRRDEANDTLYLSMNDNAKRKPRRHTPSDGGDADCDDVKATSRAATSDDVSEGGCGACDSTNGTRMRVTDAIAQWTNMAKTNNDVDYRRWRRGGSTPSAPGSPDTITDSARWPSQASSAYVER